MVVVEVEVVVVVVVVVVVAVVVAVAVEVAVEVAVAVAVAVAAAAVVVGLKFKLETYITVGQFQPGTKVKYGPNPKRAGSKSFKRYAGYQHAKTIGEALKYGSKVADLMWELQRGDYKILGGSRSEACLLID